MLSWICWCRRIITRSSGCLYVIFCLMLDAYISMLDTVHKIMANGIELEMLSHSSLWFKHLPTMVMRLKLSGFKIKLSSVFCTFIINPTVHVCTYGILENQKYLYFHRLLKVLLKYILNYKCCHHQGTLFAKWIILVFNMIISYK